jgi:hypothetical protein
MPTFCPQFLSDVGTIAILVISSMQLRCSRGCLLQVRGGRLWQNSHLGRQLDAPRCPGSDGIS